jgi:hypothetical protein
MFLDLVIFMADYEFPGLRQALLKTPSKLLCRLEDCVGRDSTAAHNKVLSGLRKYFDKDIVAIYSAGSKDYVVPNNFVNSLFIRGELCGVNDYEMIFQGPKGTTPQGIEYKGSTWIVPISQLIDVVAVSDYEKDDNPYGFKYKLKEFEFSIMAGETIEKVRAFNPLDAYFGIIQLHVPLQEELERGPTTPIKLKSIKDVVS